MTVSVKFADRAWARLAVIADRNGITVPQLLEGGAIALGVGTAAQTARTQQKAVRVAHVISLREQGWKVAQIAEKVGVSTSFVSRVLCENGHRTHTERSTT
ncbi:helix-turn-helix domain-containing protein [Microbacterium sp. 16-032]|uniref:helix-turn-helix domain-containing protein n=1 Tax=Microbacterium sp. 16-032 TaxID=3239808 RepID=UPI0034E23B43